MKKEHRIVCIAPSIYNLYGENKTSTEWEDKEQVVVLGARDPVMNKKGKFFSYFYKAYIQPG